MHGSQDMRIEPAAEEGVIFNLSLVPDAQFVRFALQWGSEFQVLEPDDVRHALRLATRRHPTGMHPCSDHEPRPTA